MWNEWLGCKWCGLVASLLHDCISSAITDVIIFSITLWLLRQAVPCPVNSAGTPPSCSCDSGYSGTISAAAAGYTGTCACKPRLQGMCEGMCAGNVRGVFCPYYLAARMPLSPPLGTPLTLPVLCQEARRCPTSSTRQILCESGLRDVEQPSSLGATFRLPPNHPHTYAYWHRNLDFRPPT